MKNPVSHLAELVYLSVRAVTFTGIVCMGLTSCTAPSSENTAPASSDTFAMDFEATADGPAISGPSYSGTGGAGDAGGGTGERPTFDEIRGTVAKLTGNTFWAAWAVTKQKYLSAAGHSAEDFLFSPGSDVNLRATLDKIYEDMFLDLPQFRPDSRFKFNIEFKETGACPGANGEDEQASTILCQRRAPICLSLEKIQELTPKAGLEFALRALLMHEVAHQNCADEAGAKQVEEFYGRKPLSRMNQMLSLKANADLLRLNLTSPKTSAAAEAPSMICENLRAAGTAAFLLHFQIVGAEFGAAQDAMLAPLDKLKEGISALSQHCADSDLKNIEAGRPALQKEFNAFAAELSKETGMLVWDFADHRFP